MILTLWLGCSGSSPEDTAPSTAPDTTAQPEDTATPPPGAPILQLSTEQLDFGNVGKDCPADPLLLTLTLTNDGESDLLIDAVSLSGSGSGDFSHSGSAVTLASGASSHITEDGWLYAPEANTIDFYGAAIPKSGETVRITYTPAATCE
ncbi:MAG: hypothetical protein ACI8RZ_004936 [Myxococcota bacterium]|jgi:hypothetical protein